MRDARLDEAQVGIKIAGRNINNIRYEDDTTLMAKSEEELCGKQMGGKKEIVTDFIFLGSKIPADGDCIHEIKKCLLLGRKAVTN